MKNLSLVLIIALSIFIIVRSININKNKRSNSLHENYSKLNNKSASLERYNFLEYRYSYENLNNISLETEKGDSIDLKSTCNDNLTLYYRYFDINCQTCVLNTLKILQKDLPKIKYKIIASYDNHNELILFKRINNVKSNIYNLKNHYLIKEIDQLEMPYFVIIDKSLKIYSIHLISPDYKTRNTGYIYI